jgi:hypothetical protein
MSAPNRKGTGLGDGLGIWLAIGAAVVIGCGSVVAAHLGSWMAGLASPPAHPILVAGLAKGRVPWPVQSTIVACVLLGILIALTVTVLYSVPRPDRRACVSHLRGHGDLRRGAELPGCRRRGRWGAGNKEHHFLSETMPTPSVDSIWY